MILGIFSEDEESGRKQFKEFMKQENSDQCLDVKITQRRNDEDLYTEIQQKILNGQQITVLQTMDKQKRDEVLRQIKEIEGVTQRQIARVTGISQSIVFKA